MVLQRSTGPVAPACQCFAVCQRSCNLGVKQAFPYTPALDAHSTIGCDPDLACCCDVARFFSFRQVTEHVGLDLVDPGRHRRLLAQTVLAKGITCSPTVEARAAKAADGVGFGDVLGEPEGAGIVGRFDQREAVTIEAFVLARLCEPARARGDQRVS